MARFRSIDSAIWQHPAFRRAPLHVREVFLYLFSCAADDEGRFVADPEAILEGAFGRRHPVEVEDIAGALADLAEAGLVLLYDDGRHGCLPGWYEHQCPAKDRRSPSPLPEPPTDYPSWEAVEDIRTECAKALGRSLQQVSYRDAMAWDVQRQRTVNGPSTERQRGVDEPLSCSGSGSGSGKGSKEGAVPTCNGDGPPDPDADPPPSTSTAPLSEKPNKGTAKRLPPKTPDTAHDPATGNLPPDAGMLLSNHPDLCEAVKQLLPEWTQPQRDNLVCQIGIACRDPATCRLLPPDRWPALLSEHTPALDHRGRPDWWVEDRVKDARKTAEAASRTNPPKQPAISYHDREILAQLGKSDQQEVTSHAD